MFIAHHHISPYLHISFGSDSNSSHPMSICLFQEAKSTSNHYHIAPRGAECASGATIACQVAEPSPGSYHSECLLSHCCRGCPVPRGTSDDVWDHVAGGESEYDVALVSPGCGADLEAALDDHKIGEHLKRPTGSHSEGGGEGEEGRGKGWAKNACLTLCLWLADFEMHVSEDKGVNCLP